MRVFISWSGERSRLVAQALRDWLPELFHNLDPWMSAEDIQAGERWGTIVDGALDECNFGILCVTEENQRAPWVLFEAGALAKFMKGSHVIPYLIGLQPGDLLSSPLNRFQMKQANKEQTWDIVKLIDGLMSTKGERTLGEERLKKNFNRFWPDLDEQLKALPATLAQAQAPQEDRKSDRELMEEMLEAVREMRNHLVHMPLGDPDAGSMIARYKTIETDHPASWSELRKSLVPSWSQIYAERVGRQADTLDGPNIKLATEPPPTQQILIILDGPRLVVVVNNRRIKLVKEEVSVLRAYCAASDAWIADGELVENIGFAVEKLKVVRQQIAQKIGKEIFKYKNDRSKLMGVQLLLDV